MSRTTRVWPLAAIVILCCADSLAISASENEIREPARDGKFLSMFEIVHFPNDACSGGSKNGTCYTQQECKTKGGKSSGTCAGGYGVCCNFELKCGGSQAENNTYFTSSKSSSGGSCTVRVCPMDENICQFRLDFNAFTITGPFTLTDSTVKILSGASNAGGAAATEGSQCQTDIFHANTPGVSSAPGICGTNTGEHMYLDTDGTTCATLDMQLGTGGVTRNWDISVSQFSCDFNNLAPQGCTQWFYGSTAGTIRSYNYNAGTGYNLANQKQVICIRREKGSSKICYTTKVKEDFEISGADTPAKGFTNSKCCGYGMDGKNTMTGYDCLQIPDPEKKTGTVLAARAFCGAIGLVSNAIGTDAATICSQRQPFVVTFLSDNYEGASEAKGLNKGFQLIYNMS